MDYNPLSPEVRRDPYPYYAKIRRDGPFDRIEAMNAYAVSRYDDVPWALRPGRHLMVKELT
jgi:cytochrome P450